MCASTPLSCELCDLEADDVGVKRPSKRHVGVNTQLLFDAGLVDFQMPLPHLSQKNSTVYFLPLYPTHVPIFGEICYNPVFGCSSC